MTTTDIAKLRELLGKATPGEWSAGNRTHLYAASVKEWWVASTDSPGVSYEAAEANAALIAATHNALPALLDAWEALVEILDIVEQGDTTDVWKLALQNAHAAIGSQPHER